MKELIQVRVQYASRQQCCKTHKWPFSDASSGTVGPDSRSEMTASGFESDVCCVAFHCHAVGLVLRKWNWLYVSGCERNSQCGTSASVCLVIVLKYVVIENKFGAFQCKYLSHVCMIEGSLHVEHSLYQQRAANEHQPDQILLGISEPASLARSVRWLGRGYPVPLLAP